MDSPHGAAVKAEGFGLKGPRGWVFRDVGIDAAPGSLVALEGPSGSGRTCLLLALTGRMKATEGHAEIGRHRLPKKMAAVRRITALGPVPGVNDLDQALTVAEQLREGAMLQRRYDAPLRTLLRPRGDRRATARTRIDEALAAVALDPATLPKGERTSVRDLERLEAVRLSVAIALLGGPRLLALDDLDLKLSDAERAEAWALLRSVADRGTTVLAVCSEAPEGVTVLRTGEAAPAKPRTGRHTGKAAPARAAAPGADGPKITWGLPPGNDTDPAAPSAARPEPDEPRPDRPERDDPEPQKPEHAEPAGTTDNDNDNDEDGKGTDDALAETGRA
ncbi:ATP-binding cassette domain-containing protein [Streptomyces sp. WAC07061]|uniref:ATP-binding cassette domain-containing protein n=1 Tax=Streptomyces sp. WAC07061 TaxID=2487410 RepID=UPI000F78F481|nr:ATP-binding cassette domain-containing protein [Streptomyces sp. WAC07061]RSS60397.1 ATP-binding cassette domain-containing protein [Streptomyces sp. WAC07061]